MSAHEIIEKCRIDKWLYAARFFKTRSLAAEAIERGRVYMNESRVKPAKIVSLGDMLKIRIGDYQYEVKVLGLSNKRGSAPQAQLLYCETDASCQQREVIAAQNKAQPQTYFSKGRPTKRDRRDMARFKEKT